MFNIVLYSGGEKQEKKNRRQKIREPFFGWLACMVLGSILHSLIFPLPIPPVLLFIFFITFYPTVGKKRGRAP